MNAALLSIGDEIVAGLTVDRNSSYLAEALRAIGVDPVAGFAVPDEREAIVRAFDRALTDAEVAISTGGLGPTSDDLTTVCVAELAGRELVLDEESLRRIAERFRARGLEMPENNRKQAMIPAGSEIVPNPLGTAPGFICPMERPGGTRWAICLPGVPREMRRMAEETVAPWLACRGDGSVFASRVFSTVGLPESSLDELLAGAFSPEEARLGFRAAFPRVQARVTVTGAPGEDLNGRLDELERRVRERLGSHMYAVGDEGLEETVGRMLTEGPTTVAVAESCTGGLIGHRLTEVPGSSRYFLLGVVAYANEAKIDLLGVRQKTLERFGAVSTETAEDMAAGVRRRAGSDLGLATTGIAGPGGGTAEKPVGTVCIAVADTNRTWSRRFDLGARERDWIKALTAQLALDAVRRYMMGELE